MYCKLLACAVFFRELCLAASRSPMILDIEFTEKGEHGNSARLRHRLQGSIDATTGMGYDAILLGYGLCGNSCADLVAREAPLVIPRAHDCCTLFLGSRIAFREHFQDNPSRPFSAAGYMERGDDYLRTSDEGRLIGLDKSYDEYVKLYGEENARYIIGTLTPTREIGKEDEIVYIEVPETAHLGYAAKCRQLAQEAGKRFRQLPGSIRLLESLVAGDWDEAEFLVVASGKRIVPVYDWDEVVRAG